MNREIKFRGKRLDNGEWVYGYLVKCGIPGKAYILPVGSDANESNRVGEDGCLRLVTFEVDPATVGQNTGLKDRNGKEIYDLGDIIKTRHKRNLSSSSEDLYSSLPKEEEYTKVGVLEYYHGHLFGYRLRWNKGHLMISTTTMIKTMDAEVIGNIYEHSHLLGGESSE